ncbi:MAG: PilZ domain-containing protein [Acidobacteriota bacterium]|nr:PilZ domain-containing protein [Acidobacteriota bacterium]
MTIRSRATQDRRNVSRVMARLNCSYTSGEKKYDGVIVNLSLKGAFISSKFLPPEGSTVTVELKPPAVKKPLSFQSTVLRGTWAMSEHGKMGRFGIRFDVSNPDLMLLVARLHR